jgi:transcriptional regulator with XRE-family HTH domain
MIKSLNTKEKALLKNTGRNLRRFRMENDLSQEELAYRAGIDRTFISDIERGTRNASVIALSRIADALKVNIKELINSNGK